MGNGTSSRATQAAPGGNGSPFLQDGRQVRLDIIPLGNFQTYPGRVAGIACGEATPASMPENNQFCARLRPESETPLQPSQADLRQFEQTLRHAAFATNETFLLGVNGTPAVEVAPASMVPLYQPSDSLSTALGVGVARAGTYQLMQFPIGRLNGVTLPANSSIRFADPTRWFRGAMETRLFSVSVSGTKKYYAWDAHVPVGHRPHDFYHVNHNGMHALFGHSNHASLGGAQLVQARQLRYLKIGGRVFLVVGVLVDTVQLGSAAAESIEQGSVRPIAAQTVRTGGSWAMAWAGAKAGVVVGAAAGIETGPGLVLTAIGGGIIGGVAGYFGADWVADFIYED